MVATGIMFAAVTGVVRHIGSDMPAVEAAFLRYLFGLIMVLPMIMRNWTGVPNREAMNLYLVRGLVHGAGVNLWFYAMARIPIAEVTAIGYLAPIFVTIGAALFLGEKFRIRRVVSIIVGFIGVLIILRPGFQEISAGQLAQLCAAPLFAISFLITKKLTGKESSMMIVGMLSLLCTLVLLPGAIIYWQPPTLAEVLWLILTAAFATAGHYTMTLAYQAAPISILQPIGFLQLIWATLLGVTLFDEAMDPFVLVGGGIVVAAVSYISHREMVARREKPTPPDVAIKF